MAHIILLQRGMGQAIYFRFLRFNSLLKSLGKSCLGQSVKSVILFSAFCQLITIIFTLTEFTGSIHTPITEP